MELAKGFETKIQEFLIRLSPEDYAILREVGMKRIQEDDDELINYAVVALLKEWITEKEAELKKGKAK